MEKWRAIATRYENRRQLSGALCVAAALNHLE